MGYLFEVAFVFGVEECVVLWRLERCGGVGVLPVDGVLHQVERVLEHAALVLVAKHVHLHAV